MSPEPIRILHLIASNFVGGPEKQILHHALDIRGSDFEVRIGSFRDQPERAEILRKAEQSGLLIYESCSSGRFDPRAISELAAFLRREKIALLCTHGFKATTVGVFAKKLAGIPQIAFCRGWTGETARVKFYEFLERRLLGLADRVVCVSQAQAEFLGAPGSLRSRISVVRNALLDRDIEFVNIRERAASKVRLGLPGESKIVGVVGRLSTEKGQRYLVEAAPKLVREFPKLKIVLLGEGRERPSLESMIRRLGVQDAVLLPGFQNNVGLWMEAFDALANCSLTEGTPNAILEAMAAGTPVVATEVGGVPALIKNRETGLLVPPCDADALASGLIEVLGDIELSATLSEAGRNWVRTQFSAAGQREALLRIYRETLGLPSFRGLPSEVDQPSNRGIAYSTSRDGRNTSTETGVSKLPFLSIVLPVRNEETHIGSVLQQLGAQNWPHDRLELLVVDGDSLDGTARAVGQFAERSDISVRLIANPRRLSSAGRNLGARSARGEYVFFVDGHCSIPSKDMLRDAVDLFEKTGSHCLCRPQPLTMEGNSLFQDVAAHVRATALAHGTDSTIYELDHEGSINPSSAGALYRKDVFDQIGYYDERFDACEDVEFNTRVWKADLKSFTSPRLMVTYQPRKSVPALLNQMIRYGQGRCRLLRKHPDLFSVSQIVPLMFLLWLVLGGVGALVSRTVSIGYLGSLALYASCVLIFSVTLGIRFGIGHLLLAPVVYLSVHLGLGAGFLKGLFENLTATLGLGRAASRDWKGS